MKDIPGSSATEGTRNFEAAVHQAFTAIANSRSVTKKHRSVIGERHNHEFPRSPYMPRNCPIETQFGAPPEEQLQFFSQCFDIATLAGRRSVKWLFVRMTDPNSG